MKKIFLLLFFNLFLFSCLTGNAQVVTLGNASYYADKFHNRKTANGERYHRDSMTAAHKTLPFGTIVRVTNPKTNKTVIVRINDRGPMKKGRKIDLSKAAAKKLGITQQGVVSVKIEVVKSPED